MNVHVLLVYCIEILDGCPSEYGHGLGDGFFSSPGFPGVQQRVLVTREFAGPGPQILREC